MKLAEKILGQLCEANFDVVAYKGKSYNLKQGPQGQYIEIGSNKAMLFDPNDDDGLIYVSKGLSGNSVTVTFKPGKSAQIKSLRDVT